ncbi:MAG: hypothetical protein ACRCVA_33600 [Phreatobacter sp.]
MAPTAVAAATPAAPTAEAQPVTLAAAPVPAPSPLRTTTTIARSTGDAPVQASVLSAFAPAEPPPAQQSGNWFTRLIGTGTTAEAAPTPAATPAAQAPATGAPGPLPRPHASVATPARVN